MKKISFYRVRFTDPETDSRESAVFKNKHLAEMHLENIGEEGYIE